MAIGECSRLITQLQAIPATSSDVQRGSRHPNAQGLRLVVSGHSGGPSAYDTIGLAFNEIGVFVDSLVRGQSGLRRKDGTLQWDEGGVLEDYRT